MSMLSSTGVCSFVGSTWWTHVSETLSHTCSRSPFSTLAPSTSMLFSFSSGTTLAGSATSLSFFFPHIPWRVDWCVGAAFVLLGIFAEQMAWALNTVGIPSMPILRLYIRGFVREQETRRTRLQNIYCDASRGNFRWLDRDRRKADPEMWQHKLTQTQISSRPTPSTIGHQLYGAHTDKRAVSTLKSSKWYAGQLSTIFIIGKLRRVIHLHINYVDVWSTYSWYFLFVVFYLLAER